MIQLKDLNKLSDEQLNVRYVEISNEIINMLRDVKLREAQIDTMIKLLQQIELETEDREDAKVSQNI
jgi:hypothetical protein